MREDTRARKDELKHGVRKGFRRHSNTDGRAQIKQGTLWQKNKGMAQRLGIPFKHPKRKITDND